MENAKCTGNHDIYVAEVVGVEKANKIVVVTVCRLCDFVHFHEHVVEGSLRFLKQEEKEKIHGTL